MDASADAVALTDLALSRLLAIKWQNNYDAKASRMRLVHEYLRRLALWKQELLPSSNAGKDFDVAEAVGPMPTFVTQRINDVWWPHLDSLQIGPSFHARRIGERYLHWVSLLDEPKVAKSSLPCPYEPIIRLYERGGDFYWHHGWVDVCMTQFVPHPLEWYQRRPPFLPGLDDETLDGTDLTPTDAA